MEQHFYNVNVQWNTDRKGTLSSPELQQFSPSSSTDLEVATPPEFPNGVPGIWSPEHLFTAAVSSCLMTTFLAIAENSKLEFVSFRCESKGKLEKVEGKYRMSEIILMPDLLITRQKDVEKAQRILEKSEAACLISNSILSKVTMKPSIRVAEAAEVCA